MIYNIDKKGKDKARNIDKKKKLKQKNVLSQVYSTVLILVFTNITILKSFLK